MIEFNTMEMSARFSLDALFFLKMKSTILKYGDTLT